MLSSRPANRICVPTKGLAYPRPYWRLVEGLFRGWRRVTTALRRQRSHLRIVSGAPIHATRCTRPRQTVTPPHLAATQRVDRSAVRGVELGGALLEADAVLIAMGALVADGRRVVGSASCLSQRATTRNARSESVVTSVGRPLVSTRKQSPDVIKHRSIV